MVREKLSCVVYLSELLLMMYNLIWPEKKSYLVPEFDLGKNNCVTETLYSISLYSSPTLLFEFIRWVYLHMKYYFTDLVNFPICRFLKQNSV